MLWLISCTQLLYTLKLPLSLFLHWQCSASSSRKKITLVIWSLAISITIRACINVLALYYTGLNFLLSNWGVTSTSQLCLAMLDLFLSQPPHNFFLSLVGMPDWCDFMVSRCQCFMSFEFLLRFQFVISDYNK